MQTTIQQANPEIIIRDVLQELIALMGLEDKRLRRELLTKFFMLALPRFAETVSAFDEVVRQHGLPAGLRWVLPTIHVTPVALGVENVPLSGPVLIASNHPGGTDFVCIIATLPRDDARLVVALHQIDLLPNVAPYMIYTSRTKGKRQRRGETTLRIAEQLQQGRCVTLFPRGVMEPEPRWSVGARASLAHWSSSLERFAVHVPELTIVPTVVSGTLTRKALAMNWLRLYKSERYRQRVAALVQTSMSFIRPQQWNIDPLVQYGKPVICREVGSENVMAAVSDEMERMLSYARAPSWPLRSRTYGWQTSANK